MAAIATIAAIASSATTTLVHTGTNDFLQGAALSPRPTPEALAGIAGNRLVTLATNPPEACSSTAGFVNAGANDL